MRDDEKVILEFFKYYGSTDHWEDKIRELLLVSDGLNYGQIEFQWRYQIFNGWNNPPIPNPEGKFYLLVNCSDTFQWGCADLEAVTLETLPILFQTAEDIEILAEGIPDDTDEIYEKHMSSLRSTVADLFCARVRKLRPQNVCYGRYPVAAWHLFDEAGPERETDASNPFRDREF